MRNIITRTGFAVCAVLAAFAVGPAQAEFPEKPVTIVVPWQAGSSPDVAMRTLASLASDDLGQPIVVQNIVGGSGSVGTLAVRNAE
ncbi:MAG: tripartite tricarboxylate transporter substrate binding protein, partial [Alphaproteobacteria bacterium]|nr:tripartite tricarboxylate transporter substrate binding protein [Alphaproteobacteria bacterium]